ncbi:MAG: LTA synthase family protein [Planctomycetota bacterium]
MDRSEASKPIRRFSVRQWLSRPSTWVIGLVVFWAVEASVVQVITTSPGEGVNELRSLKDASRRMVINLAASASLICFLNRTWLYATFVLSGILSSVLIAYAAYFKTPLSSLTLRYQWREGLSVADYGWALIPWTAVVLLILAVAFKVKLRQSIEHVPEFPGGWRRFGFTSVCLYFVAAFGLVTHKPIERINMGTPQYIYGYSVAWAAEILTNDPDAILADALQKAERKSDRLTEQTALLQIPRHVTVVQVESLDYAVLSTDVDGQPVMPFLQSLQTKCPTYRVEPFHETCSADADFSLLMTSQPNGKLTPFQVPGFPYERSLPALAREKGFQTAAIHGNTGAFFHRRRAYERMQFTDLYFSEELKPLGVDFAQDDELLQFSAELLNQATDPTFHFVITITSHGPFNRVPEEKSTLFRRPADIEQAYMNSMRFVDEALERYFESIPDNTLLVIYGDHESGVSKHSESDPPGERVPWIFCWKSGGQVAAIEQSQRTFEEDLHQLDLVTYLRNSFENASHGNPEIRIASEPDRQ